MKEQIFNFINEYAVWGILLFACIAVFLQWRMLRQQKRLNRNLGMIIGRIQDYFNVILTEEEPEEAVEAPVQEIRRTQRPLAREEQQQKPGKSIPQSAEEEEVFNAVMQEFFS